VLHTVDIVLHTVDIVLHTVDIVLHTVDIVLLKPKIHSAQEYVLPLIFLFCPPIWAKWTF